MQEIENPGAASPATGAPNGVLAEEPCLDITPDSCDARTSCDDDAAAVAAVYRDPELIRILVEGCAKLRRTADEQATSAIIMVTAASIERHGDDGLAFDELSEFAIHELGMATDVVQAAMAKGVCHEQEKKFAEQKKANGNGYHGEIGQGSNGIHLNPERTAEPEKSVQAWPIMGAAAKRGIIGRIAALATENSEADPVAIMASVLVYAAAEFGRTTYIRIGDSFHQSRHFITIVGQSSRGRKGTSFAPVERIFLRSEEIRSLLDVPKEYPSCAKLQFSQGPLSSGEGLIYAIRDGDGDEDPGVSDKRLLVVEEEFGTAMRMFQRSGNNLSTTLRRLWDGGTTAPLTKNSRIKATWPHVNILGHITKPELSSLLSGSEIWNGFANRVLWVLARRGKVVPFPTAMDDTQVEEIARELAVVIIKAHAEKRELWMTEAAADLWRQKYEDLTQDYPGTLGAVTSRQEAHVRRLALTYALLDGADQIEVHHLEAALAFTRYAFESAAYLFGDTETDPAVQKIIDAVKAGPKTQTDIIHLFDRNKKASEIAQLLEDLQERGRITLTKEKTGGAPRKVWSFAR
jgi:hypothetical protein